MGTEREGDVDCIFAAVLASGTLASLDLSSAQAFLYYMGEVLVIISSSSSVGNLIPPSCFVLYVPDLRARNRESFDGRDNVRLDEVCSEEYELDVPKFGRYAACGSHLGSAMNGQRFQEISSGIKGWKLWRHVGARIKC